MRFVVFLFLAFLLPALASASQLIDAQAAYKGGDSRTALKLYQQLADQGNVEAQWHLGVIYEMGFRDSQGGLSPDPVEAMKWFKKSADAGNVQGMYDVGDMYYRGRGVPTDYAEAATWFRKAGSKGDIKARINLVLIALYLPYFVIPVWAFASVFAQACILRLKISLSPKWRIISIGNTILAVLAIMICAKLGYEG